jgi:hypothetical protein
MPNIVNVVVRQQVAGAPNTLQQTGALISQGATTLSTGSIQLLTQASDLTPLLKAAVNISGITWSSGVATVTTTSAHGIPSGDTIEVVISGVTPTGYNGTVAATYISANSFSYPLVNNPGSYTSGGAVIFEDSQELYAMVQTFFAQGNTLGVYILELGAGTPAQGVTALSAYLINPVKQFYSYLLPYAWDTEPTAVALARAHNGTTAQVYFYVSTTLATYSNWEGIKSVFAVTPSPAAPVTEFSTAAFFWTTLSYNPSAANLAAPLEYTYIYGVTAYSTLTNTQATQLLAAGVNYVGTGAQGGISNTLIEGGNFMDLNPFNYWYCTDWLAINVAEALAGAIINGSNLSTNPLYYNQAGINTLQKVAQATVNNGISFGLILSPAVVTAVPFSTYVAENPGDYAIGAYNGLACTFVPQRGFAEITIYLTASNIPT